MWLYNVIINNVMGRMDAIKFLGSISVEPLISTFDIDRTTYRRSISALDAVPRCARCSHQRHQLTCAHKFKSSAHTTTCQTGKTTFRLLEKTRSSMRRFRSSACQRRVLGRLAVGRPSRLRFSWSNFGLSCRGSWCRQVFDDNLLKATQERLFVKECVPVWSPVFPLIVQV